MSRTTSKVSVAAIVLTFNEEKYIRDCLESLTWCNKIWVVDSCSTDRTLEIAKEYTSNIVQRPFEGFAKQRNWALDNLTTSGEWILVLDADERVPQGLRDEICDKLRAGDEHLVGYFVGLDQFYWGKHLRFGGASGAYCFRLYRKGAGRYPEDRLVHESFVVRGKAGCLQEKLKHLCIENIVEYIDKVNWYSSLEAQRMFATGKELYTTAHGSYTWKNQVLKFIFRYLPFKPLFEFLYHYFLLQGFRDGYRGFLYAAMRSFYVFASYAKLWELKKGIVKLDDHRDESR